MLENNAKTQSVQCRAPRLHATACTIPISNLGALLTQRVSLEWVGSVKTNRALRLEGGGRAADRAFWLEDGGTEPTLVRF